MHDATHPGSSPLTRGKLHHIGEDDDVAGLIPAHAGKTAAAASAYVVRSAHPRSRGENAVPLVETIQS